MYTPIIKWVGGKTQIMANILSKFPLEMNNYYELFIGGGSVLLSMLELVNNGKIKINEKIYAFDVNIELISMYNNIKNKPLEMFEIIDYMKNEMNKGKSNTEKEKYYYTLRDFYNKIQDRTSIECSALFIFLNKTCFRGIYRVSKNGFNVPYGNNKNPEIINKEHIISLSKILQPVIFSVLSYKDSILLIKKKDFCYLDPPYMPISRTSFTKYTIGDFTELDHKTLFTMCDRIPTYFVMSNSDSDLVKQYFPLDKYYIESLICKRKINNSTAQELIICKRFVE